MPQQLPQFSQVRNLLVDNNGSFRCTGKWTCKFDPDAVPRNDSREPGMPVECRCAFLVETGQPVEALLESGKLLAVDFFPFEGANLDRFVGGATEETIIARVGEGIVTSVGSAASYKTVLENPDLISRLVLEKGVDAATAFEILSIDIADVDIADNVGARLQTEQAEADKQVAQAKAEMRRAAAVALEQEMAARTQEMRAKVVEAEAMVPAAIADAFRNGRLGVMDYAKYENVMADTKMRDSIGEETPNNNS